MTHQKEAILFSESIFVKEDDRRYSSEVKGNTRHDELFKVLLEKFFLEFIDLFFPFVGDLIDRKHIRFLPQEIIVDIAAKDKHIIDILVETRLKEEKGLVVIHVENQSQRIPG